MKNIFFVVLSIVIAGTISRVVFASSHPAVLDTVEQDFLDDTRDIIAAKQGNYHVNNGRYFQGMPTHSSGNLPYDGLATTADRLGDSANDIPDTWYDFIPSYPVSTTYSLRLDYYNGIGGSGYVMVIQHVVTGQIWEKKINVGTLSFLYQDWHKP